MIDKAWVVIIFMYIASFTMLGIQWTAGDYLNHDMTTLVDVYDPINDITTPAGTKIKPLFADVANLNTFNDVAGRVTTGTYTNSDSSFFDRAISFATAAAYIAWDVISILTGTYIFTLIFMMGVPYIFVTGISVVYVFFLIRTIIALIRGV